MLKEKPDERRLVMRLACTLTDDEVLAYGRQLARAQQDLATAERRKSELAAQAGATVKQAAARVEEITSKVASGIEEREVECVEHLFKGSKTAITRRSDTGEIVSERPLTDRELQGILDFPEDGA